MDSNIHDNIDDLFRERFSDDEAAYVPGAWEKLEKMLNEDSRKTWLKNAKRFTLASLAGAVVLAGSVVAYISGYDTRTATFKSSDKEQQTVAAEQKQMPAAQPQAATEAAPIADDNTVTTDVPLQDNMVGNNAASGIEKTINSGGKQPKQPVQETNADGSNIMLADNDEKEQQETAEAVETVAPVETAGVVEEVDKNRMQDITLLEMVPAPAAGEIDFETINIAADLEREKLAMDSASRARKQQAEVKSFYRLQYGFYAGANFNKVLSNEKTGYGLGSGLLAGVFAGKNFSNRWAAGIELNYIRRNSNSISRTISQTDVFFYNTKTNFYIVTESFDYLQLPISATYRLTSRHSFNLGLVGGMMMNAHSKRVEQYIVDKETTTEFTTKTYSVNGVYEDLNRFTYGAWAGYEFRLPGIYSLGVRYNQMLNDITLDRYFKDGKRHAPSDIQVYLKVNLNK